MVFVKLFRSIYDGSLATRGPWEALITFQQMLVLCDRFGIIDMTPEAIARHTTLPLEIITKGIERLEQPDPESRRADEEGRRIVRLDPSRSWGWQIVNYAHYRQLKRAEERRDYQRKYMAERRAKANGEKDTTPVLERIPMLGGEEFEVHQSFADELARLYPAVDIPATLKQMRGWCLGNPAKLKTPRGIRRFITSWCDRDQNGPKGH